MSQLADWQIRELALDPNVRMIEPFAEGIKRPGVISFGDSSYGYDFRIGNKFKVFSDTFDGIVDVKNPDPSMFVDVEGDYCLIPGNSFVLAETVEYFRIPRDILCIVLGKSSYARMGLVLNVTPGEPEWDGRWTLEISNTTKRPAKVYAGEGIGQVVFLRGQELPKVSYKDKKGKYQLQAGLTLSKVDK